MPTFGEKDQRFTVAVGPNSPFPRGQPIPIPGLGVGYPSDVGPDVKGIDIPVPRASMRNDPRFNRTVMINGRPVRLTAYPPAAADPGNVDPTGGGNFDASGNRIIMYGGQPAGGTNRLPRWYQPTGTRPPVVLATNELPQPLSGANPFAGPDLTIGRPEVNPPPNENRTPLQ